MKKEPGATRIEGKGVVMERGQFSLKLSVPDLTDVDADSLASASADKGARSWLKGGKVEIIFRQ